MIRQLGLKPPDATHIATALVSPGIVEMHTFDGSLLNLAKLKICKPNSGVLPGPLLKAMSDPQTP
jgi:hypothetical protein